MSRLAIPCIFHGLSNKKMKLNFSIGPLIAVIICIVVRLMMNNAMNNDTRQQRLSTPVIRTVKHTDLDSSNAGTHLLIDSLPL
jgi:hypothetical protein